MSQHGQSSGELWVCHLGLVPYSDGLTLQETLRERRIAGTIPDTLLVLEHPPTYTYGRRSGAEDLPLPESFYAEEGIEVHATDRGGKLTYHGPGQMVGYPIMAAPDVLAFLRAMEHAIIDALAQVGIGARSRHEEGIDYTGVWVEDRKIASIGVHVSRGVATHGFAVNVSNDLEPFSWVIACGLPDVQMTSLAVESGARCESLGCFRKRMAYSFARAHSRRQRLVSPWRLGIDATNPSSIKNTSTPTRQPIPA
jgi:lipoyl(octanoyl) transferase